jgi:hypothetical protein
MNELQSFSHSAIAGVNDAQSLAAWNVGADPTKVVLPLSVAAAWAYADKPVFDEVMSRRGLRARDSTFVEIVNDAMFVHAKAYIQPVGTGAIVAFRGTEPTNVINWLADASVQKVAFHASPPGVPRGYVHGGFYRNTRALWPKVVDALHEMRPEWLYITGHSFGAALAVLAAALLADYSKEKPAPGYGGLWPVLKGVFTFGQPMVGDELFTGAYADTVAPRLVRFVYAHDIVPHLPPKTDGWRPVHFGAEYRGQDATKWTRDENASRAVDDILGSNLVAIAAWVKDQIGFAPRLALPYSWGDHAPNNYVRVSLPYGANSGSEFD